MLIRLELLGWPLIRDAAIEFAAGLNVLTGESGAGKSLVLSALRVLLGQGTVEGLSLRAGAEARVVGELDLRRLPPDVLSELGLRKARVQVERMVLGSGRARARIDGQKVPLAKLSRLMRAAVSLTSQNAARELATAGAVLDVLDQGARAGALVAEYRAELARLTRLDAELAGTQKALAVRARQSGRLADLVGELEALAPKAGEHAELARRIEVLGRAQHYLELCARVEHVLSGRESPIEAELSQLATAVRRAPPLASFSALSAELATALGALERAGRLAERVADELVAEPGELARLEKRFDAFEKLSARLGVAPDALAAQVTVLEREMAGRSEMENRVSELEALVGEVRARVRELALLLHARREQALAALSAKLQAELRVLSMPGAELVLDLMLRAEGFDRHGLSRLGLSFSAMPGMPALPFERVASGGERSRLVLALACAGAARGRSVVFDEIDQGVGGEAVDALGARLARLGREQQVIVVTHQAAIAARAERHLRVRKLSRDGAAISEIVSLGDEERTLELSRMLTGGRAADGARALARRLLEDARRAARAA